MATKTKHIASIRKGEIYETAKGLLLEVASGKLRDDGDQGTSFEGRTIEFNVETGNANRTKTTDRFYLDELRKKLTKAEYEEWVEAGRREAEALQDAQTVTETKPAKGTKKGTKKPAKAKALKTGKKLSQLDAAAQVLGEAKEPLAAKAMIEAMATKGLWTSPNGQTPHATLYAAIIREIASKGEESRFAKVDKGLFTRSRNGGAA